MSKSQRYTPATSACPTANNCCSRGGYFQQLLVQEGAKPIVEGDVSRFEGWAVPGLGSVFLCSGKEERGVEVAAVHPHHKHVPHRQPLFVQVGGGLQRYLDHKKHPPRRTLM